MVEGNPHLMQLRLLQALGESTGNTVILGHPSEPFLAPAKAKDAARGNEPP